MIIDQPLFHHARARSSHPAIIFGTEVITYAELNDRVSRTASHLSAIGVKREDAVALALSDSVDHVVLLLAVARSGAVLLPLDWRWTAEEQLRVAEHFQARLALVEPHSAPLQGVRTVAVDDEWRRAVEACPVAADYPSGDGPLLMSLSSGTTGRPKGPRLLHSQLQSRFLVAWINLGFNSQDRFLCATPLYYGGGRSFTMSVLYSGGTLVLFPPPHGPDKLCEEAARVDATGMFLVPTLLRRLLALDDESLVPMQAMRFVISSGSVLHPAERHTIRTRICRRFIQYYASTEGGGVSYLMADEPEKYDESVGRPVFGVDVECVGENDRPLLPGEVGRVRYRGPGVADGFFNDPEASKDSFRDGWYYPGDLGLVDDDGYLYLKGRDKDVIVRGGINIYPAEIEALLLEHPDVRETAVVGWPSREFNEEIAAFVIVDGPASESDLLQYCRENLARYKWPREVFRVETLPRSSLGKILKNRLSEGLRLL